jgi:hypothetical protein
MIAGTRHATGRNGSDIANPFIRRKPMANLIHNERVKMSANLFNNLGVASLATGFIVPLISVALSPASDGKLPAHAIGAFVLGFISFVLFAAIAQIFLKDLRE